MSRRISTRTAVLILLAVIAAPFAMAWGVAAHARAVAEAESFAVLARAGSPAELRTAVGPLGVVLELRGGA
jgi:hypothetical protein